METSRTMPISTTETTGISGSFTTSKACQMASVVSSSVAIFITCLYDQPLLSTALQRRNVKIT
jgi:hypothetical protein